MRLTEFYYGEEPREVVEESFKDWLLGRLGRATRTPPKGDLGLEPKVQSNKQFWADQPVRSNDDFWAAQDEPKREPFEQPKRQSNDEFWKQNKDLGKPPKGPSAWDKLKGGIGKKLGDFTDPDKPYGMFKPEDPTKVYVPPHPNWIGLTSRKGAPDDYFEPYDPEDEADHEGEGYLDREARKRRKQEEIRIAGAKALEQRFGYTPTAERRPALHPVRGKSYVYVMYPGTRSGPDDRPMIAKFDLPQNRVIGFTTKAKAAEEERNDREVDRHVGRALGDDPDDHDEDDDVRDPRRREKAPLPPSPAELERQKQEFAARIRATLKKFNRNVPDTAPKKHSVDKKTGIATVWYDHPDADHRIVVQGQDIRVVPVKKEGAKAEPVGGMTDEQLTKSLKDVNHLPDADFELIKRASPRGIEVLPMRDGKLYPGTHKVLVYNDKEKKWDWRPVPVEV